MVTKTHLVREKFEGKKVRQRKSRGERQIERDLRRKRKVERM